MRLGAMGVPNTADGTPDGTAEFRIMPRQRRNVLIATAVLFVVFVVAWLIVLATKSWGVALGIAVPASLCLPVYLYCYFACGAAYTRLGPDGISGRNWTGRYGYRWEQIGNVARREVTTRGSTTYTIILTTTDGDRIRLGAPVSGGIMDDPEFDVKYARIREAWQAATGRTGPEEDTKPIWTRGFVLLMAAIFVQIFAGAAFAALLTTNGPALRAHEGMGTRGMFTAEIQNCSEPDCTWFGQFTSNRGTKYATLAPGDPNPQESFSVPAVDTGAQYTVYPRGGGTAWEAPAEELAAAGGIVIFLFVVEIAVPLYRRHRRRRRRAWAGLPDQVPRPGRRHDTHGAGWRSRQKP